ncbi:hypothetical protein D3C81_1675150 [compost metagenome]
MHKPRIQFRCLTATVIKKCAVAVNLRVFALKERLINAVLIQQRVQGRSLRVLYTVIRPERLRQAVQLSLRVRGDLMLAGKAAVISRMPVQTGNNLLTAQRTPVNQAIGDIHGAITFWNGKCASGTKIVL